MISFSYVGGIKFVKNLTLHTASVLSISAVDHWLGIGAADNSMSLFHRPQERFGGFSNAGPKAAGWQLYRTPQKTAAVVRVSSKLPHIALFSLFVANMFSSMDLPSVTSSWVDYWYPLPQHCKINSAV